MVGENRIKGERSWPWTKARKRDWKGPWYQVLKTWMMERGEERSGWRGRGSSIYRWNI